MSTLLKQVYILMGIRSLRTTPFHPQTDGLTERFNQTLKQVLRKFVNNSGTDWDQWLPYILFAYKYPKPPLVSLHLNFCMVMKYEGSLTVEGDLGGRQGEEGFC